MLQLFRLRCPSNDKAICEMKPYSCCPIVSAAPLKRFVNFFTTYIHFIALKRLGDSRIINSIFIHAIVLFISIVVVQIKVSEQ